jgi:hypothetical protein
LTTSADFQALFQRGRRIDRPALIVLWREIVGRPGALIEPFATLVTQLRGALAAIPGARGA